MAWLTRGVVRGSGAMGFCFCVVVCWSLPLVVVVIRWSWPFVGQLSSCVVAVICWAVAVICCAVVVVCCVVVIVCCAVVIVCCMVVVVWQPGLFAVVGVA